MKEAIKNIRGLRWEYLILAAGLVEFGYVIGIRPILNLKELSELATLFSGAILAYAAMAALYLYKESNRQALQLTAVQKVLNQKVALKIDSDLRGILGRVNVALVLLGSANVQTDDYEAKIKDATGSLLESINMYKELEESIAEALTQSYVLGEEVLKGTTPFMVHWSSFTYLMEIIDTHKVYEQDTFLFFELLQRLDKKEEFDVDPRSIESTFAFQEKIKKSSIDFVNGVSKILL